MKSLIIKWINLEINYKFILIKKRINDLTTPQVYS